MGVSQGISEWIVKTKFEDLPPEAVQVAKRMTLDTIGVALAAAAHPLGKPVIDYTHSLGGVPEASVVGGALKTNLFNAAFANGVLINILDFDDTWFPLGHPSSPVFPTVMALGEKLKSPGSKVIEAYVIGLEVWSKIIAGRAPKGESRLPTVGAFGALAAAAAASKLLLLNEQQTRMSLGIAASHASGLRKNTGTMTKAYHAGNAASGGLRAALLAQAGWTADPEPIEGIGGFAELTMGYGNYDPSKTLKELGNPFHLVDPGVGFKKYPVCYLNQRPLDAILELIAAHSIHSDQVESIIVGVPNETWMNQPDPDTGLRARLSLQHNLAEAIISRKLTIDGLEESRVHSGKIREMMKRVQLRVDPSIPADYVHTSNPVTIHLRDGRKLLHRIDIPHGDWDDPLSESEVRAKFEDVTRDILGPKQRNKIIDEVAGLEDVKDITTLMSAASKLNGI